MIQATTQHGERRGATPRVVARARRNTAMKPWRVATPAAPMRRMRHRRDTCDIYVDTYATLAAPLLQPRHQCYTCRSYITLAAAMRHVPLLYDTRGTHSKPVRQLRDASSTYATHCGTYATPVASTQHICDTSSTMRHLRQLWTRHRQRLGPWRSRPTSRATGSRTCVLSARRCARRWR